MATRIVHLLAVVAIVAGFSLALMFRFALTGEADRISRPRQPSLFYGNVGPRLLATPKTFGVAHNAGDTPAAARQAVATGADVVEIDVVVSKGRLRAAHDRALPATGRLRLKAPAIEEIWRVASRAETIELDLKQTSVFALEPLVTFLRTHRGPAVFVSSRSVAALRTLRERTPWVERFLSIATRTGLIRLRLDPGLEGLVQGVSVREQLLDATTIRWLNERGLVILAWVVDDSRRAAELLDYGVDGIATNDLRIIGLLTGQRSYNGPR